MTTQGERHTHRAHGSRRRAIALSVAGAVAIGIGVVVAESGDWQEGAGRTAADAPTTLAPPSQPLTEGEFFAAERYFPAAEPFAHDAYKARRTVGRQGPACVETLVDRNKDVLADTGCLGYVVVGFTRDDQQVHSSVTVLRFADGAAAEKARQLLADPDPNAAAIAFVVPEAATVPTPSASPSTPPADPQTRTQVDVVGHYLTVTSSRFADLRPTSADQVLEETTRAVSFIARAPFLWL